MCSVYDGCTVHFNFTNKIYSIIYFITELVCLTREHNHVSVLDMFTVPNN